MMKSTPGLAMPLVDYAFCHAVLVPTSKLARIRAEVQAHAEMARAY